MELSFRLKKTPDYIFGYLTDVQKFVLVHPVISKIDQTDEGYLVHETLNFGPIPFSFTYPASITSNRNQMTVTILATVMKVTEIEMKFVLVPDGDFTIVNESVNFKSILPIRAIMQRVFAKQHATLFRNIEAS